MAKVPLPASKELSAYFNEFLQRSTFHGLGHISRSTSVRCKLLWLAVVSSALIFCVHESLLHISSVNENAQFIYHSENRDSHVAIPEVIVCTSVPVILHGNSSVHLNSSQLSYVALAILGKKVRPSLLHDWKRRELLEAWWNEHRKRVGGSVEDILDGITLRDFVQSCQMPNLSLLTGERCCDEVFQEEEFSPSSKCFSSRSSRLLRQVPVGKSRFSIRLRYLPDGWIDGDFLDPFPDESYLFVYFADHGRDMPFHCLTQTRIPIARGMWNEVVVKHSRYIHERQPRRCSDGSNWYLRSVVSGRHVSYEEWQRLVLQAHGCVPLFAAKEAVHTRSLLAFEDAEMGNASLPVCGPEDILKMVEAEAYPSCRTMNGFFADGCMRSLYTGKVLESPLRDSFGRVRPPQGEIPTDVTVYFRMHDTTDIIFSQEQFLTTLSDIGGIVSLSLGGSFISMMEVFVLLFGCLRMLPAMRKKTERTVWES